MRKSRVNRNRERTCIAALHAESGEVATTIIQTQPCQNSLVESCKV